MPTRLHAPLDAATANFESGRSKGLICQQYLVETETFRIEKTSEVFTIRDRMTWDPPTSCTISFATLAATPNTSGKQQQQQQRQHQSSLRTRFYQHRSNINTNTGTHVTRNFNLQNHTLANMKFLTIEKVHTADSEKRQERESFWIRKTRTLFPLGRNMQM